MYGYRKEKSNYLKYLKIFRDAEFKRKQALNQLAAAESRMISSKIVAFTHARNLAYQKLWEVRGMRYRGPAQF